VPVAVAIDLALVAFFGVVHSLMARRSFQRLLVRVWPAALERSLFVFVASLQLGLLCLAWRPIGGVVWQVSGVAAIALRAVAFAGWGTALLSTFLIDHAALFGLRQAFGRAEGEAVLRTPLLYRYTRHPLYLGMLVGLWAGPSMSAGHALLATAMTAYILVGVRHEERDLERVFGDDYRRYRDEVPMLLPIRRG
jgi:protein-S-isoprenylcysteine O-methyltransferase Ste14